MNSIIIDILFNNKAKFKKVYQNLIINENFEFINIKSNKLYIIIKYIIKKCLWYLYIFKINNNYKEYFEIKIIYHEYNYLSIQYFNYYQAFSIKIKKNDF